MKEDFWEIGDLDLNIEFDGLDENKNLIVSTKSVSPKCIKYENAELLAKKIDLVNQTRYDCIIKGNFVYGDFIEAFFVENDIYAEELTISTLSFGYENVDSLKNLIEGGYVGRLRMLSSVYFYANERKKGGIVDYLFEQIGKDRLECAFADVHKKCVLFKTLGGKPIVITGSANLRSSGCIEQFVIEKNQEAFDFYNSYHDEFFKMYGKEGKPLRVTTLNRDLNAIYY